MGQAAQPGGGSRGALHTLSSLVAPEAMGEGGQASGRSRSARASPIAVGRAASRAARAVSPGQVMLGSDLDGGGCTTSLSPHYLLCPDPLNSQSSVSLVLQVSHHIMQFA